MNSKSEIYIGQVRDECLSVCYSYLSITICVKFLDNLIPGLIIDVNTTHDSHQLFFNDESITILCQLYIGKPVCSYKIEQFEGLLDFCSAE